MQHQRSKPLYSLALSAQPTRIKSRLFHVLIIFDLCTPCKCDKLRRMEKLIDRIRERTNSVRGKMYWWKVDGLIVIGARTWDVRERLDCTCRQGRTAVLLYVHSQVLPRIVSGPGHRQHCLTLTNTEITTLVLLYYCSLLNAPLFYSSRFSISFFPTRINSKLFRQVLSGRFQHSTTYYTNCEVR